MRSCACVSISFIGIKASFDSKPERLRMSETQGSVESVRSVGSVEERDATAVRDWLDGTPNNGIAIVAAPGTNATFDSKENSQKSHEPGLIVTLNKSASPSPALTS